MNDFEMDDQERLARYEHGANVFGRFLSPASAPIDGHDGMPAFVERVNQIRAQLRHPDPQVAELARETLVNLRQLAWPEEMRAFEGKIGERRKPVDPADMARRALLLRVRELSSDRAELRRALQFLREELDREQLVRRVAADLVTEKAAMRAVAENALLRKALLEALLASPALDVPIRNPQIVRVFCEARIPPVLRAAAGMTKADILRLKGMGPGRYAALMKEFEDTGLPLPHLLRDMAEEDPAPLFVEEGVAAEVAWDPLGSPLNRELDMRLERLLTAGGLPGPASALRKGRHADPGHGASGGRGPLHSGQ